MKYYRRQGHVVRLEPANPAYAPLELNLREQELGEQELVIEALGAGVIRTALTRRQVSAGYS